jgi:hypothetical protein
MQSWEDSMNVERSRITLLAGVAALILSSAVVSPVRSEPVTPMTVYKSPT